MTIGREVRLPAELIFKSTEAYDEEKITSYGRYVDSLRSRIQHAHEEARDSTLLLKRYSAWLLRCYFNFVDEVLFYLVVELL